MDRHGDDWAGFDAEWEGDRNIERLLPQLLAGIELVESREDLDRVLPALGCACPGGHWICDIQITLDLDGDRVVRAYPQPRGKIRKNPDGVPAITQAVAPLPDPVLALLKDELLPSVRAIVDGEAGLQIPLSGERRWSVRCPTSRCRYRGTVTTAQIILLYIDARDASKTSFQLRG